MVCFSRKKSVIAEFSLINISSPKLQSALLISSTPAKARFIPSNVPHIETKYEFYFIFSHLVFLCRLVFLPGDATSEKVSTFLTKDCEDEKEEMPLLLNFDAEFIFFCFL